MIVVLLKLILTVIVVLILFGFVKGLGGLGGSRIKGGRRRSRRRDLPYDPEDVVEGQWEDIDDKE